MEYYKQIKKCVDWCIDHKKEIIGVALGIWGISATSGYVAGEIAEYRNAESNDIQADALARYNEQYVKTNYSLEKLGKLKFEVVDTFDQLAGLIERIQNRPRGLLKCVKDDTIPELSIEDLKILSNVVQEAKAGAEGGIVGACIGFAVFGFNIVAIAPALFMSGSAIGIKGASLLRKSFENRELAEEFEQTIDDKELPRLIEIQVASDKLYIAISDMFSLYRTRLERLSKRIKRDTIKWNSLSTDDKLLVRELVDLVKCLQNMCMLNLIDGDIADFERQHVNVASVSQVCEDANDLKEKLLA